jgi:hypothetical protein
MKNSLKIAIFSLLFGVIVDVLFYKAFGAGINVLLLQISFLAISYTLAQLTHHKLPMGAHVSAALSLGFAAPFLIWTSTVGISVAALGLIAADVLFVAFLTGEDARVRHPFELFALYIPIIVNVFMQLPIFGDMTFKVTASDKTKRILIGLAILIPIFILFTALFASADAVFNSYVNIPFTDLGKFLHLDDVSEAVSQGILILFVAVFSTLLFGAAFWNRMAAREKHVPTFMGETESTVILGGIVALFAVFLLVQGMTMFGGEAAMRSLDMTYAEYAREGFNQLIIVAILVASLSLTVRYLHGEHAKKQLLALHALLIVETLLVLVSAFLRVNLYIDTYGYTPERLLAMATIGTLGVLFLLLLGNIVQRESQAHFVERGLVALGICGIIFSLSGPDAMAANLNVKRALAGKSLDIQQIADLSMDADPALLNALTFTVAGKLRLEHPENYIGAVCRTKPMYDGKVITDWRVWNLSMMKSGYITDDINQTITQIDGTVHCGENFRYTPGLE